jgi:hypothetical protein
MPVISCMTIAKNTLCLSRYAVLEIFRGQLAFKRTTKSQIGLHFFWDNVWVRLFGLGPGALKCHLRVDRDRDRDRDRVTPALLGAGCHDSLRLVIRGRGGGCLFYANGYPLSICG